MYGKKSTHLHIIPAAKNPKHNKFDFFLLYGMGVDLSSRDNFANLGSFAKVQVSKALKAQLIDLYKHLQNTSDFVSCQEPGCYVCAHKNLAYLGKELE